MENNDIKNSLKNNSPIWRELFSKFEKNDCTYITGMSDDYLGLLVRMLPEKRIAVLCEDQIKAGFLNKNLNHWGVPSILMPCSWTQLTLEELEEINKAINIVLAKKNTIFVMSMEEWEDEWMYKHNGILQIKIGKKYSFMDLSRKLIELGYSRVKKLNTEGEFSVNGDNWMIKMIGGKVIQLDFDGKLLTEIKKVENSRKVKTIDLYGILSRTDDKTLGKKDLFKNEKFDVVINVGTDQKKLVAENNINIGLLKTDICKKVDWPLEKIIFNVGGQKNFLECWEKYKLKKGIIVTKFVKEFRRWITDLELSFKDFDIIEDDVLQGGIIKSDKIGIWTDAELFGRKIEDKKKKKVKINFKKLSEYKIGDLVVHSDHGIGMLKDFTTKEFGQIKKDYLVILYDKGDLLYVPTEQLNKISKYIGSKLIGLNRLGGKIWQKRKKKARKQVEKIARELLRLYAQRKLVKRKHYLYKKTVLDRLNKSFDYELTVDQEVALDEINADLDKNFPMDRLLCGDVGFGKTELAIRVAARVGLNKKQVAILAPTTILTEQHFITFVSRLSGLGLRVEVLSRLRDKKYQENVIKAIKSGKVDIVIGTHRLLQRDIKFKNLGLLIIDEEQKFGVRAKEKLKEIRSDVDVLSLSATPIPRTLNMSMGGVRDLSILEIAPEGRQSIETQVLPYSQTVLRDAVMREVARGGQVYIVHNRVRTIQQFKGELEEILPKEIKIGVAHGQMSEHELSDTMSKFATEKYQVLLATTIVENGLDLPNVNTLIVENASGLGLSQLYQLRGRVGRSKKKAYAYFLHRSDKLKAKAKQRLVAISEATELGSGLKLAISDMEIRGVGNVLGVEQHGNAYSVGLGMFLDMLEERVDKMKDGDENDELFEDNIIIELPVSAYIPNHYIVDKNERLFWEQRIAVQSALKDVDEIIYEIKTKYGQADKELENLGFVTKLRILAQKHRILKIDYQDPKIVGSNGYIVLEFADDLDMNWINYMFEKNTAWILEKNKIKIHQNDIDSKDWLKWLFEVLEGYGKEN